MTDDERMQRESSLIATIRREFPEFAKACADALVLQLQFAVVHSQPTLQLLAIDETLHDKLLYRL